MVACSQTVHPLFLLHSKTNAVLALVNTAVSSGMFGYMFAPGGYYIILQAASQEQERNMLFVFTK